MPVISEALFSVYRRVDGAKFMGHLTTATATSSKEKAPYRVMYCRNPTFIKSGDTILTNGGEVVILMDQPDDFAWASSFKAVYALEQKPWVRPMKVIDPVSKVQKYIGDQSMGTLYVNFDTPEEIDFMGMQDTKYRFITGQDVRVDDKVGGYVVKRIEYVLGVKIAFAE